MKNSTKGADVRPKIRHLTLEVCIDTPGAIAVCAVGGADRIELCSALALGGLTPSPGLMAMAACADIPAHAMIRPTDGGFSVSPGTLEAMFGDIAAARDFGLAGVVLGATTPEHTLDLAKMEKLVAAAGPMEVTLHRAIDICVDPLKAVDQAIDLGITRILTSGGAKKAYDGRDIIRQMVDRAAGRITIMAGSGVTAENVAQLVVETGVRDVHGSCRIAQSEAAEVAAFGFGPATRQITDAATIRKMRQVLDDL